MFFWVRRRFNVWNIISLSVPLTVRKVLSILTKRLLKPSLSPKNLVGSLDSDSEQHNVDPLNLLVITVARKDWVTDSEFPGK